MNPPTWLILQLDPAAPSLGDLAAWLATAAAAWVPGSPSIQALINGEDFKACALPEMQAPLTVHGRAHIKLSHA